MSRAFVVLLSFRSASGGLLYVRNSIQLFLNCSIADFSDQKNVVSIYITFSDASSKELKIVLAMAMIGENSCRNPSPPNYT